MSYNVPAQLLQGGTFATNGTYHNTAHGRVGVPAQGSVTVYTGLATVQTVTVGLSLPLGSVTGAYGSVLPGGSIQIYTANGTATIQGPGSVSWVALGV